MDTPAASVIITHFSHGPLLLEAVASALAQPGPSLEVIIVDDGSPDDSATGAAARWAHDPRLRLIRQDNRGQLAAFETGVGQARGEFVFLLDADDRYQPGYLEAALAAYRRQPGVDFLFCAHTQFGEARQTVQPWPADRDLGCSTLSAWLRQRAPGSVTSTLSLRRELARELFPVPPEFFPAWRTRADDCLVLGASLAGAHKAYLAHPWVEYRVHAGNLFHRRAFPEAARYRHERHTLAFVHWLAEKRYLDPGLVRKLHTEFKTIPQPTREEYRLYRSMAWEAPLPLGRRLSLLIALGKHYRRTARSSRPAAAG